MNQATAQNRFEAIVELYSKDLFRFLYWLSRDRSLAEDLVQETFLRAWKSIDSLRDEEATKSWLITIARREHARIYERKRLEMQEVEDLGTVPEHRPDYDTSTEAFVLRRALTQLPDIYREPLLMQNLFGYTAAEIGEQLGITPTAVATRITRARQQLFTLLEGKPDDEDNNALLVETLAAV